MLRIDNQHQVTHKKSDRARHQQELEWSQFLHRPEQHWKEQIKLYQHGKVPPGCVQIHEVHRDIDESQPEQAQNNSTIHRFESGDEWRQKIDQVRDPIHRVEPNESRKIPAPPTDCSSTAAASS